MIGLPFSRTASAGVAVWWGLRVPATRHVAEPLARSAGRVAVFAALVLGFPLAAHGQFSVRPVVLELVPAETAQVAVVQVRNEGGEPLEFRFYVADFDQSQSGDHEFMDPGRHARSCAARLEVFPTGAALLAGEVQDVRVRLQPGAETCWSLVFAETSRLSAERIRVGQRIGVKVYGLSPSARRQGELLSVAASPEGDSVEVVVEFRNTGEVPLEPEGRLEIRTLAGQLLDTVRIGQFGALPGRQRRVTLRAALPAGSGRYLAVPILDYGGDHLVAGQALFRVD